MSIHRHVYIRLRPEARSGNEFEAVCEGARSLRSLAEVRGLRVLRPADTGAQAAWDLCLHLEFARLEDVAAYREHPDHRHFVDDLLAPRLLVLKAWNFDDAETTEPGR